MSGVGKGSTAGDGGMATWPPQWAGDVSVVSRGPEALLSFEAPGSTFGEGGSGALDHAEAVSRMMAQRSSAGDDSAKWFTALFSALQVREPLVLPPPTPSTTRAFPTISTCAWWSLKLHVQEQL